MSVHWWRTRMGQQTTSEYWYFAQTQFFQNDDIPRLRKSKLPYNVIFCNAQSFKRSKTTNVRVFWRSSVIIVISHIGTPPAWSVSIGVLPSACEICMLHLATPNRRYIIITGKYRNSLHDRVVHVRSRGDATLSRYISVVISPVLEVLWHCKVMSDVPVLCLNSKSCGSISNVGIW